MINSLYANDSCVMATSHRLETPGKKNSIQHAYILYSEPRGSHADGVWRKLSKHQTSLTTPIRQGCNCNNPFRFCCFLIQQQERRIIIHPSIHPSIHLDELISSILHTLLIFLLDCLCSFPIFFFWRFAKRNTNQPWKTVKK